ncbi:MAG TPA: DUF4157 domain-containing protein [Ruminiclostridium sp.]|nr:DUF4157 domain-containing protein [Ruminiclostridium sp.]
MFEVKSKEGPGKIGTANKAQKKKADAVSLTQRAAASYSLRAVDTAQPGSMLKERKFADLLNQSPLQRVTGEGKEKEPLQLKKEDNTGMPPQLKAGIESLSGMDLGEVKVHYNSQKPAEVGALAYTQGTDIHVASGQEKHLPHEAWHVVQQAQGRVQPTTQLRDLPVNDDSRLEHEAEVMGNRALSLQLKC